MIMPMKKAAIITLAKDAASTVKRLRSLGVLHVQHQQPPQGKDIASLQEEIALLAAVFNVFSRCEVSAGELPLQKEIPHPWPVNVRHIINLWKRYEQLEAYSYSLKSLIAEWEAWGDFDPQELLQLAAGGVYVSLCKARENELKLIPGDCAVKVISRRGGINYLAVFARQAINLPFPTLQLPKQGLSGMRQKLDEDAKVMAVLKEHIRKDAEYFNFLRELKTALEKELELQQAINGMCQEGQLSYIAGFLPLDKVEIIEIEAREQKWGLVINEPSEDEEIPVLLRNPFWIRMINPVMRLLNISPGYRELDVSPVFLVFFSIFVGILIGDAGYGLSYFLLALFLRKKFGNKWRKEVFFLLFVLSFCAIVWGILTANLFGHDWLVKLGYNGLLPALSDDKTMQVFCFFLGAFHLTLGHAWRAFIKFPSQALLADLGWIGVVWVAYSLACALILGGAFFSFGLPLAVISVLLVLFFSEPRKNIFKRMGAGFGAITFGLSFMSAFTDVVSYVRLFAVGLAGVAIANTTNAMAAGLGGGIVATSGGILIKIIGHSLNIALGPIAILVHGVRLNVLEFGLNHTGITWSGLPYRPLAE